MKGLKFWAYCGSMGHLSCIDGTIILRETNQVEAYLSSNAIFSLLAGSQVVTAFDGTCKETANAYYILHRLYIENNQ